MCTGLEPAAIAAAAGINAYGTNAAANTAARNVQAGTERQENFAKAMGTSQYLTGQELSKYIPDLIGMFNQYAPRTSNFAGEYSNITAPDLLGMFNANAPNVSQYFDPSKTNTYYDRATSNLNQSVGANVNRAQSQAGAIAAARGYANPGSFTLGAGQSVRDAFAPQYGQIEQSRAGALANLDRDTYSALAQQALQRAGFAQQGFGNQMSLTGARVGAGQQDFANALQLLMSRFGAGQQGFNMQKAIADFSGGYNPTYVADYYTRAGGGGNSGLTQEQIDMIKRMRDISSFGGPF